MHRVGPPKRYDREMMESTLWPILVSAVVSTLIGWVWYHPRVFGATWMRLSAVTPEMVERGKKRMPLYTLIAFAASVIVASVMNHFVILWGVDDLPGSITLGFLLWIGFTAPPMLGMVLWEHKPIRSYLIVSLYWLVAFITMATILAMGSQ